MQRVTGLSLVDNQYVFVRGLGERYSNTTLAGSVLPTTEPDKKVVPLDLFPDGLIDSVKLSKSYSPDRSAKLSGGLVQIVPIKLPHAAGRTTSPTVSASTPPLLARASPSVLWVGAMCGANDDGARALPSRLPRHQNRATRHLHAGCRLHT